MRNLTTTILRNLGMLITDVGWRLVEFGDNLQIDNCPKVKCPVVNNDVTISDLERGRDEAEDIYDDDGNYLYD